MCTNKGAQADEQKTTRNEGFSALPAMHLLCMSSMLVPCEFSHFRKCRGVQKYMGNNLLIKFHGLRFQGPGRRPIFRKSPKSVLKSKKNPNSLLQQNPF